ncbi:MarR family winged helix-turn-helix transcriptional regulator [Oerskovia jenensis]|uniref:DNA-binding MarR family transcriptional regulator n=1 Tax=Oerskovia jenensis TaxID=162169 RepID=A0ABS2LBF4_9CELL|nr:MarR family transcriptional regulator [Oerskovia jenensis]MBM7477408.1 DNA-binding MarR family transcriptional regulator [Oerskovia jenensis]
MHASRGTESSERLLRRLREVGTEIALFNRRVAASMGIREADLVVLDVVHRTGPASPSQLSACTGIHAATMTGILTRLEDDGWIERLPAPGDRRGARIRSRDPERLEAAYAEVNRSLLDAFSDLDDRRADELSDVLATVAAQLRDVARDRPPVTGPPPRSRDQAPQG